jgi:hypothetical protein
MNLIKMSGFDSNLEYLEIVVDSYEADNPGGQLWIGSTSPSNQIVFSWPKFYWTYKSPQIVAMKIISAEIPHVWDVINTINRTLIYTVGGVPNTITLATGTFTGAQIATALQVAISAITAGFTVTYDSTLLRFTFTQVVSASPWTISFPTTNSLYAIVGFLAGSSQGGSGAGSAVTSSIIAQVAGPHYLYLNSRALGPTINFNLTDDASGSNGGPQIARIPIIGARNSVVFYTNPNAQDFFDCFTETINQFDLYLTLGYDQQQLPLDMKGASWSVKIGFLARRQASEDLFHKPVRRGITQIK